MKTSVSELDSVSLGNLYCRHFRRRLARLCEAESPLRREVEIDESYFGGRRIRGKRERGAFKKVPVFGLLKRNGKVYTQVVPNCSRAVLTAILKGKVALGSVIYSDEHLPYRGLSRAGFKHNQVSHGVKEYVRGNIRTNSIEGFSPSRFMRPNNVKFKPIHSRSFRKAKNLRFHAYLA